jgi:outer membrane protein assembly factor BamB
MVFLKRSLVGLAALSALGTAFADFDGPAPIAWRWADRITQRPSGSPTIIGDQIYAAVGSRMYCLNRESGNEVWRFPPGEPLQASFTTGAVVAGDLMVAAADDKSVYGVNTKTGEMVWQYIAPSNVITGPVVAGSAVVVALANNQLMSVDLRTGQPVWDAPYSPSNGAGIYSSVTSWQNSVIFLTSDGNLNSIDATTKAQSFRPRSFSNVGPLSGLAVYGDVCYITSGAYVTSIMASSGRIRWEAIVPGVLRYAAAVGPEGVVVVTDDGRMHSFSSAGRPAFRNGIDLNSSAVAAPAFTGSLVAIPTSNGSLNLIDPVTGDVEWNFTVPPMIKGMKVSMPSGGTGGAGGAAGGKGGAGLGGGRTGGAGGGAALGGGGGGQAGGGDDMMEVKYVTAAGPAVTEGDMLVLLATDGSILAFDKALGVDLTSPEVSMVWPNAGDQVSGRAPMELVFIVSDAGSGVDYNSAKVTINGQSYVHQVDRDGRLRVPIISSAGPNFPLNNGRARIIVSISDWMENNTAANFTLSIDNTLPALGSPKAPDTGTGNTGGGGGLGPPGRGGRGGGGRSGGGGAL